MGIYYHHPMRVLNRSQFVIANQKEKVEEGRYHKGESELEEESETKEEADLEDIHESELATVNGNLEWNEYGRVYPPFEFSASPGIKFDVPSRSRKDCLFYY